MTEKNQPMRRRNIAAIVEYFASGVKDKAENIGIELEHTLLKSNGEPVSYLEEHGQRWLLEQLSGNYDEQMRTGQGQLIGLAKDGASVTLEPAAQVELSAGPFASLKDAKGAFTAFAEELEGVLDEQGIQVLTPGYHPTRRAADLELIPKRRYELMNSYLGAISAFGVCMMRGSASTQVSIDYTSLEDCLRKLRLACACVPVFSLICDNSPVFEAEPRKHRLVRTEIWEKCDPARCMIVPGMMGKGFTLEDYANYILDTPAIVDVSSGEEEPSSQTFGEIYANSPMERTDVEHALSMFFTDVRLKTYIEIRPADAMPVEDVIAYAAMVKGLFYSEASLDAMEALFDGVTEADIAAAKASLMKDGYSANAYGHAASTLADELIGLARDGLSEEECPLLEPLAALVSERITLADIASRENEEQGGAR